MKKRPAKTKTGPRSGKPDRLANHLAAGRDRRRPRFPAELSVLYEDDAVVVLDKPAGLLAVPIKGSATPSALSLLAAKLKLKKQRALVVHRIDRFASGALLFAKTKLDREILIRQFLGHTPLRQYLAVVRGRLAANQGTLIHYFRRQGMLQQLRTERDPKATRAELRYSVERFLPDASLLRVELVTGLQNQIRAQFAALGHPVVGDRKYHSAESSERLIARVALHAARLQFMHPRSGESIAVESELPPDIRYLLEKLAPSKRTRR